MAKRKYCRSRSLVRAAKRAVAANGDCFAGGVHGGGGGVSASTEASFAGSAAAAFEAYYRKQGIVDDENWDEFWDTLKSPLPITFRFNSSAQAAVEVERAKDEGAPFLSPPRPLLDDFGHEVPPSVRLPWVDGWQLNVERTALRRSKVGELQRLRQWLVHNTHNGVITRQELVSMVPAAVLRVEPHHSVLDLCAAPGSKTTQLLELIHRQEPAADACVVANDCDAVRAYTLSARCRQLGKLNARLVVALHPAQRFPNLNSGVLSKVAGVHESALAASEGRYPAGCFDRVLCDVPCSGDGTLRKNPEVWKRWGPGLAIRHHCMQVQIAMRGVALLKVGGLMTYSTCSLSPLENEASIAELLRRCKGALELVDTAKSLPGLNSSPGLNTWHVCDDGMTRWFSTYQESQAGDVPRMVRRAFRSSMWPPSNREAKKMKLHRCIRILPHHQRRRTCRAEARCWCGLLAKDCGGFFVALLRKTAPLPGPSPPRDLSPTSTTQRSPPVEPPRPANHLYNHLSLSALDSAVARQIKECFGLRGAFLSELAPRLWVRSNGAGSDKPPPRVWMVPGSISTRVCSAVNTVSAGVLAFVRRRGGWWEATAYGAQLVLPFANGKTSRRVDVTQTDLETLKAASGKPVAVRELSRSAREGVERLTAQPGSVLVVVDGSNGGEAAEGGLLMRLGDQRAALLLRRGVKQRYQSVLTAKGE